nr:DUF3344 domain-containing protein [Methanosarcina barkeri]
MEKKIWYQVNRGHDPDTYYVDDNGETYVGSTSFQAALPSDASLTDATLTDVHMASTDGSYTFNGNALTSGTPQGTYCGSDSWDVTDDFKSTGANTLTYDRTDAFYKNALAIMTAEYTTSSSDNGSGNNSSDNGSDNSSDNSGGNNSSDNGSDNSSDNGSDNSSDNSSGNNSSDNGSDNSSDNSSGNNSSDTSNGYTGDKPLETYAHDTVKGDIIYEYGDSKYSGKVFSDGTYTVHHNLKLPADATVKLARLYNYWTWSATRTTGVYPSMNLQFQGTSLTPDAEYSDQKGWGSVYDYPSGTWLMM